jgi:hypothetical protein
MLLGLVICLIIIIILSVHFDVAGRLRVRALEAKVNEDGERLAAAFDRAIIAREECARKWSDPHTTADQEVQRVRELDSTWAHIRYIEEVATHNDRCKRALHTISKNYKALFPGVRRTDMEMIARDVDIQGWAVDRVCNGGLLVGDVVPGDTGYAPHGAQYRGTTTQWH